ncbi:MAG: cytochrome c [Rhodospirillaceae bacterium]
MRDVMRLLAVTTALTFSIGVALAATATAQRSAGTRLHGDAGRGQFIAARWCVSCHVTKGPPLNDHVPSFESLAASDRTESEIRGFLMQPHPPMPPLVLANQEIEDLLAFVQTFKPGSK